MAFYSLLTKKVLTQSLLLLFIQESNSQTIDCNQKFDENKWETMSTPEIPALPFGNYDLFYKRLREDAKGIEEKGKVFVLFVVDTLEVIHCAKVIKSDNELLNDKAIELIEQTKFTLAMQRGKKVIATSVLSISFGPIKPKKKRKD